MNLTVFLYILSYCRIDFIATQGPGYPAMTNCSVLRPVFVFDLFAEEEAIHAPCERDLVTGCLPNLPSNIPDLLQSPLDYMLKGIMDTGESVGLALIPNYWLTTMILEFLG